jgi:protein phosphatase
MSKLVVGFATDVGLVRASNQDQLLVCPGLYAVADGMGGHAAGEVASLTAVRALRAAFEASDQRSAAALADAAKAANRAIWEQARANREMFGMGTTLVALAVVEREDGTNGLAVVHIGDSRVYLFRGGALRQLTVDHSLVQELVDDGQISQAQAAVHPQRHVLTRALGVEPAVDVDLLDLSPERGDRYVLCSDGLSREASDDQIAAVLRRFADPSEAARELVALARSRGGSDNITVVVVDVRANDDGPDGTIAIAEVAQPQPTEGGGLASGQYPSGNSGPEKAARQRSRHRAGSQAKKRMPATPSGATLRVIGFVAALVVVVGGAVTGLAFYARSTYFVGIQRGHLAIFQGRPGGVLWFGPTIVDVTSYTRTSVLAYRVEALQAGRMEPSLASAWTYIDGLIAEKEAAEASSRPLPRPAQPSRSARPTTSTAPLTPATPSSTTVPRAPTTSRAATSRAAVAPER